MELSAKRSAHKLRSFSFCTPPRRVLRESGPETVHVLLALNNNALELHALSRPAKSAPTEQGGDDADGTGWGGEGATGWFVRP